MIASCGEQPLVKGTFSVAADRPELCFHDDTPDGIRISIPHEQWQQIKDKILALSSRSIGCSIANYSTVSAASSDILVTVRVVSPELATVRIDSGNRIDDISISLTQGYGYLKTLGVFSKGVTVTVINEYDQYEYDFSILDDQTLVIYPSPRTKP